MPRLKSPGQDVSNLAAASIFGAGGFRMRYHARACARFVVAIMMLLAVSAPVNGQAADDPAAAQADDASPSIVVVVRSADRVMSDAEYLLSLTDTIEQKQWKVLKDYLEVFLIGMDTALPIRVEVVLGQQEERYLWSLPVSNFNQFNKQNLQAVVTPRVRSLGEGLYKLGSGRKEDFNGYMQSTPPYVRIVQDSQWKADLQRLPADPRPSVQAILARNFDLAVEARNKLTDAAAQAKRREIFQATRKRALAGLKKDKAESQADFELRRKALEMQLDEAEWFLAESENLLTGVTLDRAKGQLRNDIELTPIAGSELAKTIQQLGAKPSRFAGVPTSEQTILAARLNHPLNEMRKKNLQSLSAMLLDRIKQEVDADTKRTADEKAAGKQLLDKGNQILQANIAAGIADGFIDVHKAAQGKNALLAGFLMADGTQVPAVLDLVPKARTGAVVKHDVAQEGDVTIHSVDLPKERQPKWYEFIGGGTLYVGTSKDTLWFASGEGALDALKTAIQKSAQPAANASNTWGELTVRLRPWAEWYSTEPVRRKGEDKYRKMALAALLPTDDQLSLKMTRQEGKIVGEMVLQTGLLRFAGKAAADFSRENLDEGAQKPAKNARN
jgi:hypothetical protein